MFCCCLYLETKMKKIFLCLLFLGLLFVMIGCGKKKTDSIYDLVEEEGEEIRGALSTNCYPDKTCDEDLICDKRYNICIRDCSNSEGFLEELEEDIPSACNPNPCRSIANATGTCTITEDETDFDCECKTNYTWNSQAKTCDANSRNNYCSNLPANAKWNTVAQITQVWNGETWVPDNTGVYDTTPSTTECHFVCNENYDWNGTSCNGVKKTENCTGLPENASWNTVSSITQTWNGYSWTPDTKGYYNISPSTSQCRFKCNDDHYYHDDKCVTPCTEGICNIANSTGLCKASNWDKYSCECEENYTWNDSTRTCDANSKISKCIGLPDNAAWNIVASITQTWNGTEWLPVNESIYSEASSTNECRYKCKTNYSWENSVCIPSSRVTDCTGLPEHAVWNNDSTVTQTWNDPVWTPSATGSYSKNPGSTPCTFQCDEDFHWENPYCISDKKTVNCTGLPENAVWNTKSSITQTWKNNTWTPDPAGKYNAYPSTSEECRFKCMDNFFWNGTACITYRCDRKICDRDSRPHSTEECILKGANKQICVCEEGFYWWDDLGCDKKPLSLGNICTGQNECFNDSSDIPCPVEGDDFYGQDAQYAALGNCTPKSFTIKNVAGQNIIVDNNTGLEWQQSAPSQKYSWEQARDYCGSLVYGGHAGWRLPSPQEFLTIIDSSKYKLALDVTYFTNMPSDQLARIWTSKEAPEDPDTAVAANVYYGSIHRGEDYPKTNQYNVVCVWGDELPAGSFTTSTLGEYDEDVVTDSGTGLMWQKIFVETKTWKEALYYCENLEYAGYSDWRLPNRNELASLVNFDLYQPASDFPEMPEEDRFWTSSYLPYSTIHAQAVDFTSGIFYSTQKTESQSVRCVRNSN